MVEAAGVEPASYKDFPKESTCLGRGSILVPGLVASTRCRGSDPMLKSRHAAHRHGVVTSLIRTPQTFIRHPGRDVALSGESEIVIRSYFFDR